MAHIQADDCFDRLRELTADFDNFAYIVSHDLKAPVRAITNISNWIEEDMGSDVPEEVTENLQLLRNRTDRLEKMINALLVFSRVGRLQTEIKTLHVPDILSQVKTELSLPAAVTFNISPDLPAITTNPHLLKTVLQVIIDNAIRFNDKAGNIDVKVDVEEENENINFTITDNGPGIPAEALSKIFTMFYTVQVKDLVDTTGAGLAIAKKAAGLVGANIQVNSIINQGSVFRVNWPKIII